MVDRARPNGTQYAGATFTRDASTQYLGPVKFPAWFRAPLAADRRARVGLCAVPVLLLCFLTAPALVAAPPNVKGKIVGQEKLVVDVYAEAANPGSRRWSWREPSIAVDAKFRNLAPQISREICLVASNNGQNSPDASLLVKVTGGRTNPVTMVVRPETTLVFQNADPFDHTLTIVGRTETFAIRAGQRAEWKTPGGVQKLEIRDAGFPSLKSYVLTDPNVVQSVYPAADGTFSFSLTTGEYFLKAYFGGKQVGKQLPMSAKERGVLDLKDVSVGEGS